MAHVHVSVEAQVPRIAVAGILLGLLQSFRVWWRSDTVHGLLPDRYLGPDTTVLYADLGFRPPVDGIARLHA